LLPSEIAEGLSREKNRRKPTGHTATVPTLTSYQTNLLDLNTKAVKIAREGLVVSRKRESTRKFSCPMKIKN